MNSCETGRTIAKLLLILTVAMILCAVVQSSWLFVWRVRQQREAIEAIRDAGGRFYYDYAEDANGVWAGGRSGVPARVQRALGAGWQDWFHHVGYVCFEGNRANDETLAKVAKLPRVEVLVLWGNSKVTDQGYSYIGHMKSWTLLSLQHSHLGDAGTRHLTNLNRLRKLHLNDTLISDNSADYLKAFSEIEQLWVSGTKVRKAVGRSLEAAFPTAIVDY